MNLMLRLKDGFRGERAITIPQMIIERMEADSLCSSLHVTDIGFYPQAYHHYRKRINGINQYVLIYCTDGEGWCIVDDVKYIMKSNQFIILPPEKAHEYGADKNNPWTIYWIHFKGTMAQNYINERTLPIALNPGIKSRINNRIALFEEIFHSLKIGYGRENLRFVSSLLHHFLGSLCYWETYRNVGEHLDKDLLESVIHYMYENIEHKILLSDIASFAGYSTSHFSALFSKLTGQSPMIYLNHLRIQRACELLGFTDMKVNQVCYKVGIEDPYYFSRLFKQIMGCSPREFRLLEKG